MVYGHAAYPAAAKPGATVSGGPTVFGPASPQVDQGNYNTMVFLINQGILKVETMTLVQVLACTNNGGVSPSGTVDVQPLINQMTGNRTAIPHGKLSRMVYARMQGGDNAFIMDPKVNDIGFAIFCSRDMSAVVSGKRRANPGSFRHHNFADGIYIGGVLNGAPTRYVQFTDSGIVVVAPDKVTVQAPEVDVTAATKISVQAPVIDIGSASGTVTTIDGVPFLLHTHISEAPGDPTGPVIV